MSSICILTDSSAQFPKLAFPGRNLVRILSPDIELKGVVYEEGKDLKPSSLPPVVSETDAPRLVSPPQEKMRQMLLNLSQGHNEILGIFMSSHLSGLFAAANEAAGALSGRVSAQMVDSQTTSVGLGILVQAAAEAATRGARAAEIERTVRSLLPHIYTVVCTPGLSYLYHSGIVDRAQATVGEMLGLLPIFAMEEGRLTPLEKVRTHRNAIEFFIEFMDEFEALQHIALLQSTQPNNQDSRMLREHAEDLFARTPFTEHGINLPLATLLGPRTMGLIVIESIDYHPVVGDSHSR